MFKQNGLRWALVPLLCALMVVIACASDDEAAAPAATAAPTADEIAKKAAPTKPTVGKPTIAPVNEKRGGELIRATSRVHRWWDYNTDPIWFAPQTMQRIYSNLVRFDPSDGATIIPDLATDWSISEDATTFTFTVRDDVKWHDGKPLTTDDVVATFERAKSPPEGLKFARLASMLLLESITASGDQVIFKLQSPDVDFLQNFAGAWGIILPKHVLEMEGGLNGPDRIIGSGPYVMGEQELESFITTPKNPDFYKMAPDGKPYPYLDKITTVSLPDPEARIAAQQTGRVDISSYDPAEFVAAVGAYKSIGEDNVQMQVSPLAGINYLVLNSTKPPFDKLEARRAAYLIFDRLQMQKLSALPSGENATIVTGFAGTIDPLLGEILGIREVAAETRAEVLAEGQALAASVGLEGFEIKFQSTPPFFQEIAQLAAQVLEDGGMDIEMRMLDRTANVEATNSGDWVASVGTPNWTLPSVSEAFRTAYLPDGSNGTFGAPAPPGFDALFEKILSTHPGPERDELYREAYRVLREDWVPVVPFQKQVGSVELIANYVHGRQPGLGQWFNLHWYHDLWVDEDSLRK